MRKRFIKNTADGFTLLEVMVAMVVLAGGLLGYAYMQTLSLQFSQESYHRSQATAIINELADGMRAFKIDSQHPGFNQYTTLPSVGLSATNCQATFTAADLNAQIVNDLNCFYWNLANNLPNGTATIAANTANNQFTDITVFWSDRGLTQQVGFSDANQVDAGVYLNSIACNGVINRTWSGSLDSTLWVAGNTPQTDTCLIQHTWSVQILGGTILATK